MCVTLRRSFSLPPTAGLEARAPGGSLWPSSAPASHPLQVTPEHPRNMLSGPASVASTPSSSCVSTSSSTPTSPDTVPGRPPSPPRTRRPRGGWRPSWPQGRSVPRGWLSPQSRSSEKLGRKWEKRMCGASETVVVTGKKMRFLMSVLLLFHCFYFEFTGPGREQRICQSSGLQGLGPALGRGSPSPPLPWLQPHPTCCPLPAHRPSTTDLAFRAPSEPPRSACAPRAPGSPAWDRADGPFPVDTLPFLKPGLHRGCPPRSGCRWPSEPSSGHNSPPGL